MTDREQVGLLFGLAWLEAGIVAALLGRLSGEPFPLLTWVAIMLLGPVGLVVMLFIRAVDVML